tara:strand:- start:1278 stop:3293 length:2016 start_codon:yes stop_codon:yes gene_type:complete
MNQTATPGSLIELTNAHITRGGEIEKRPAFVELATLPSNTIGLAAAGGQIYVFGSDAVSSVTFAAGTPSNISYIRLQHPSGEALTDVLSSDFYNGQIYAAARFADGRIYHYYNGVRITDWFDGRARSTFEVTAGSAGGTAATASITVTGGTANPSDNLRVLRINNVDLIASPVAHTGTDSTTATNIATAITNGSHGYTAAASGAVITISAPLVGITYNAFQLTFEIQGAVTMGSVVHMSGGVDNAVTNITVNGVPIIGSQVVWGTSHSYTASQIAKEINDFPSSPEYEATAINQFVNIISKESGSSFNNLAVAIVSAGNVTTAFDPVSQTYLDGGANASSVQGYTPGAFVRPVKTKMYALSDSLLHFSGIDDPTEWNDTSTGAGFINLANHSRGSEDLKSIASYFNNIAVFAEEAVQIWFVDPDANLNQQIQVLQNTGTIAPDSVVEFGDNDVFYLNLSGIRSLRSRDSSNAAFVGDIGNPIDSLIVADIRTNRAAAEEAQAILEPRDGRYFLSIGSKVYVFSFFPSSKVSAWSIYEPGFVVDRWAYDGRQTLCRSGNKLYSLGGENGNTYDASEVVVQMPFLDASAPATYKTFSSLDVTCENTWTVSVATDPQDISLREEVATVHQTTFGLGRVTLSGYSTHLAPRLVCSASGAAKLGNLAIHYEGGESG